MSGEVINFKGRQYTLPPRRISQAVYGLVKVWETLGSPQTPISPAGLKMMSNIIDCWEKLVPGEAKQWQKDRNEDLINERSLRDSHKAGGFNPVTYPPTLYKMMKVIFKGIPFTDKKVLTILYKQFPVFRTSKSLPSQGGKGSKL